MLLAHVSGSLSSWTPMYVLLAIFVAIVSCMEAIGASGDNASRLAAFLVRIPNALQRITGIPGWAAAMVGTSMFGVLLAGQGFYSDVAWHVYTGRDKNLFTAPHTMIVLGLFLIGFAALLGVLFASLTGVETTLRYRNLRIPWSAVPLALLGGAAVSGFPLDDLWHLRYGIDVTMWSPTHLLMILGASFSPIAAWLALAEAGVKPSDGAWPRAVHAWVAMMTLQGLSAAQGEFRFGVPQFQQVYHPILIALAAGIGLVAARIVLGRGWAVITATISLALTWRWAPVVSGAGFAQPRTSALYIGSAVAVEIAAALFLRAGHWERFAIASAVGISTLGFAVEWAWNSGAIQPWRSELLPGAVLLGSLAAIGASMLGAALGAAVIRQAPAERSLSVGMLVAAGLAVLVVLAVPLPRRTGAVAAQLHVATQGDRALVSATLTPANAADHAKWFQVVAWQGGGLVVVGMHRGADPGLWVADATVPITGKWKTLLRLHRGDQLMAIPVYMPADASIPAPAIPAADRQASFVRESHYLLREQNGNPGGDWFAMTIDGLLLLMAGAWASSFVVTSVRMRRRPPVRGPGAGRTARPAMAGGV